MWKLESGDDTRHFITKESNKDLIYLVIGIVGLESTYLKPGGSQTIVQSCSGSNVIENKFSGICQRNSKPTGLDVWQVVARQSVTKSSTFTAINK